MRRAALILLPFALVGCRKSEAPSGSAQTPVFQATPALPAPTPAPAPAGEAPAEKPSGVVEGKVLERLDAAPYSYLRIKTAAGEQWAAVPMTDLQKGASAKVVDAFQMDHFESKKLKRTFDSVWLGHLAGGPASTGAPAAPPAGSPHGDMAPKSDVDLANIHVEKAGGAEGRTVAEVFAQKDGLKGKPVVVKAKVVKFLAGIMNKNWVHLRDGSGTDKGLDNDLAVTTQAELKVGDVVTLRGTLGRKRDFGSGYFYDVLLEDATVQK